MRRICFATGTRAEFGLMRKTLAAVRGHPDLTLQVVATGMHLDASRGHSVDGIRQAGFTVDREVPWPASDTPHELAAATGQATAGFAHAFHELSAEVVLVVGDRVEALAAAVAGHLSNRLVAHVHGGDRAAGQADDAMRHAITKLAHVHFPATAESADRLRKLGEEDVRIHLVGSPGIDGITDDAGPRTAEDPPPGSFALVVLHPNRDDAAAEFATADRLLGACLAACERVEIVWPNNDLGSTGIARRWDAVAGDTRVRVHRDLPRGRFLRLLADCRFLAGNSSAGIIEAASFGKRVLDVGPRQAGRERSDNVLHADERDDLVAAARRLAEAGHWDGANVYGGDGTARRIADTLAGDLPSNGKLICY